MLRDPIVLGNHYIIEGEDYNMLPNCNSLIVGTTGSGKSTSVVFPTVARSHYSNPILNYSKEADAKCMAQYLKSIGYNVHIMNIAHPNESTISFDPVLSIASSEDLISLASAIVDSVIGEVVDDYLLSKARSLLSSLIAGALMQEKKNNIGMKDVLQLFERSFPRQSGLVSFHTSADSVFDDLAKFYPHSIAVREYQSWHSLSYRTASCVRDMVTDALSSVFPECIRNSMLSKPQLDIEKFVRNKEALVVITSGLESSQNHYTNLFYRDTMRQLLRYASTCPKGVLPREIRYYYDDFVCISPIHDFAANISSFRCAGISFMLLVQSESQLDAIYKEDASIIRQNCAIYAYFPGGLDDTSCELVSKRMNMLYEHILYASLGKVFIMQSGRRPVHVERYPTFSSNEYKKYSQFKQNLPSKKNWIGHDEFVEMLCSPDIQLDDILEELHGLEKNYS